LDDVKALTLLIDQGLVPKEELDLDGVRGNKEKAYYKITDGSGELPGRMLFLHHELMISRFHFMLDVGCRNSGEKVALIAWKQGSELHSDVTDLETDEVLPHRPDAFFTLHFPGSPDGANRANFFYEADRNRTSIPKMMVKLQAHYEFIRQRKHQAKYGIKRIRAVLIETLDTKWAEELRQASAKISPIALFWFTASEIVAVEKDEPKANRASKLQLFLWQPEIIFTNLWAAAGDDYLRALDN
jgi:hypothetical protein